MIVNLETYLIMKINKFKEINIEFHLDHECSNHIL